MPRIEERIEERLLNEFVDSISVSSERQQVIDAYHARRERVRKAQVLEEPKGEQPP